MKTQLRTIISAVPALSKVSAGDLSLHLAYRLKKVMGELQKEADFFAEQRHKIFEKYGTPGNDGNYTFDGENESAAITELEALLDMEVEPDIPVICIPVSEGLRLSVNDIIDLAPFVEFKEE